MNPYLKKYGPGGETTNSPYDPTTSYIRPKKVTIDGKQMSTYSNEYRDLYNSGTVLPVYEGLPTVYAPEVEVTAQMTDKEREKRRVEAQGRVADAVRKGTGSFARPILDTGLELSGAAGTYRFAQDPIKNLKGTANILSYTNLPGLIGHGIDYAMGNPFFNVTEEDLQGLGNTLDIAGLATLGAGTAFKMAPKAISSIPRMLGKIPDVNPNMGLRFADETIEAQKALQKQPISYNKPELNKKYFQEYDYGISQSEDVLRPVQKDIEELKNTYRTEFEKQWGKEYNEKDLLSYAKIKEGIDPSGTTKFADQDFSDINNQFITEFDVKKIDDIGQANALSDYTSGRYYGFNQNATRGGHNLPFYREFMNPFLDDALNQNVLTKDIELHRGFGTDVFTVVRDGRVIENVPKSKILPGDIIDTGNRYQSTSLIKNPHFDYQEKLIVPKGTSFGYANKQGLSYVPAELELTLPRNTMYKALDDGSFKVIKDQGQGILPESSMSTVAKASDDVVEQMPNAKNIEEITTYKNDLLNRLKTTEEGKRRLANLGLTPEDLNDIDLAFNQGPSMAKKGFMDVNGNPFVNINFKEIAGGTGLTPMNTASHEIGHALQYLAAKKRFEKLGIPINDRVYSGVNIRTQADDEMIDWLKSVNQSEIDMKKSMGTYDQLPGINNNLTNENIIEGINKTYITERAEPYAHLREFRTNMMDEGVLKNEWDNVTEDMVDKFMKTSSGDRMKASLQNTPDFRKRMSMLLNKYPAVVPVAIGTGATGASIMQQPKEKFRTGGAVNPYIKKYQYGGKGEPEDPIKDILNFGFTLPKNESPIGLGNNPYQQVPNAYSWSAGSNPAPTTQAPPLNKEYAVGTTVPSKPIPIELTDIQKEQIAIRKQQEEKEAQRQQYLAQMHEKNKYVPGKGKTNALGLYGVSDPNTMRVLAMNQAATQAAEFTGVPSVIRVSQDPMGHLNSTLRTMDDISTFGTMPNNTYTKEGDWSKALDVASAAGTVLPFSKVLKPTSIKSFKVPSFNFNKGNYQNILNKGLDVHDVRLKYHNNEILDLDELDMLYKYGKGTEKNYKNVDPTNLSDAFLDIYGKLDEHKTKFEKGDFIKMVFGEDFDKINISENIQNNIDATKGTIDLEQNIVKPKSPIWNIEDFVMGRYRGPYERTAESRLADKWLTEWYDNPTSKQRFLDYGGTEGGWTEVLNSLENPIRSGKPYPKSLDGIAGLYSPKLNKASINTNISQEELIPTGVHEGAHKLRIIDKNHILKRGPSGLKNLYNDITDASKLQPEETYSEIARMRYMQGWKPETVVTMDMLEKGLKELGGGYMMSVKIKDKNKLLEIINKAPAVIPGILGTGAAATIGTSQLNQKAPQNRYGGQNQYMTTKYNNGGPVDPVDPEDENKMMQRQINSILSGKPINTGITMTKLNPDEEYTYQQWAKGLTPNLQGSMDDKNYDMRGAWQVGEQPELFYYDNNEFTSAHPIDVKQQGSIYEPHLFSRNPFTGKSLKGPNHPSFMHALEGDIKAGGKVKMDLKTGDMYTYEKGGDTGHSTVEIERNERVYTPDGKLIMETPADAPTHEEGGVKVTLPAGSLVFPKKYYKALDAASGLPAFKKIADTMLNNAEKAYLRGEAYSSGGKRQ